MTREVRDAPPLLRLNKSGRPATAGPLRGKPVRRASRDLPRAEKGAGQKRLSKGLLAALVAAIVASFGTGAGTALFTNFQN